MHTRHGLPVRHDSTCFTSILVATAIRWTLTYQDLVIAYAGSGKGSKIEAALRGPMSAMLPVEEANALVTWAQQGADRPTYETFIRPTIDKRCMSCHDGSNPHLSNLGGFDNIKR